MPDEHRPNHDDFCDICARIRACRQAGKASECGVSLRAYVRDHEQRTGHVALPRYSLALPLGFALRHEVLVHSGDACACWNCEHFSNYEIQQRCYTVAYGMTFAESVRVSMPPRCRRGLDLAGVATDYSRHPACPGWRPAHATAGGSHS